MDDFFGCFSTVLFYGLAMKAAKKTPYWTKTRRQGVWRHRSGVYYARLFHGGKEIWRTLKTSLFSVAEARFDEQLAEHRDRKQTGKDVERGKLSFGEALAIARRQLEANPESKPRTHAYHAEVFTTILRSLPGLEDRPMNKLTKHELQEWAGRYKAEASATRFNAALSIMRRIFKVGLDAGAIFRDPTQDIKRSRVRLKKLDLPTRDQFLAMVECIRSAGGRFSRDAADFIAGLAYTGIRRGEAKQVHWEHVDFQGARLHVHGDPQTGTKNWETRIVPLIPAAHALFERMRSERLHEDDAAPVFLVNEAQKALDRAARIVGAARFVHHDLRHLFATTCIEAGVDIPTVSRWLGHKDGGALAMKTYGHLRDEHSAAAAKKVSFAA